MRIGIRGVLCSLLVLLLMLCTQPLAAQTGDQSLGAVARLDGDVTLDAVRSDLLVEIPLSQPVPWRTRLMTEPPRAVVDFRTLDWGDLDPADIARAGQATALRIGNAGGGWSRLVIELDEPMGFTRAGLTSDAETGAARLALRLEPIDAEDFARQAAALAATDNGIPDSALRGGDGRAPLGLRPTLVVLDPGHGGVDPGAVHEGTQEANVTLTFARELAEALERTGRYQVVLTRDSDTFVSLEARITVAHSARADVFLSLHADALADGQAVGATVYTLADGAADAAATALAERHDRDDLMGGGVDLTGTDDAIAGVLMDMARVQTQPATDRLARALVGGIRDAELHMHRHPWQQAAFSVLKSPSVPSALLELGFLSSDADRARLGDRRWRTQMERALISALDTWVAGEVALQDLRLR
ncbi:N-acetylmuramoyl-L-alanine amidase [Rhodobacter sp. NTK016B]|nr:N-acetylmuramoyl-L-alanine amidase [Rhodobacter sp. NTK016B]